MKLKACIIEDAPQERKKLIEQIAQCQMDIEVVGAVATLEESFDVILNFQPDVVFLDIQLAGGQSGFELFKKIPEPSFDVIFVTGYDEYALQAIRFSCLDYLIKPLTIHALSTALTKLKKRREPIILQERLALLLKNMGNDTDRLTKLALPTKEGFIMQNLATITHFEADGIYSNMFTLENHPLPRFINYSLSQLEKLLPSTFKNIHKSRMVNLNLVKRFNTQERKLYFENGAEVEVSERKMANLKQMFRTRGLEK